MATPAQGLAPCGVVEVLSGLALKRDDMVALQASGPAAYNAPPAVALEDGATHDGPSARVQREVMERNGFALKRNATIQIS